MCFGSRQGGPDSYTVLEISAAAASHCRQLSEMAASLRNPAVFCIDNAQVPRLAVIAGGCLT